jgi:hypothetical protein
MPQPMTPMVILPEGRGRRPPLVAQPGKISGKVMAAPVAFRKLRRFHIWTPLDGEVFFDFIMMLADSQQ